MNKQIEERNADAKGEEDAQHSLTIENNVFYRTIIAILSVCGAIFAMMGRFNYSALCWAVVGLLMFIFGYRGLIQ